jgi:hypothetical protein
MMMKQARQKRTLDRPATYAMMALAVLLAGCGSTPADNSALQDTQWCATRYTSLGCLSDEKA